MVLRKQELPAEEEFASANDRAAAIFGMARQPVRSARSVQALADEVRRRAGALLPAAESLAAQLDRHSEVLGLDETSPRLMTARATADLANRLTGLTGATALLRALADADLPRDAVIYRASLKTADDIATRLAQIKWEILVRVATMTQGAGPETEQATMIMDQLRSASRHDEHELALRSVLDGTEQAAIRLVISEPPERRDGDQKDDDDEKKRSRLVPQVTRQIAADDMNSVVDDLQEFAAANPGTTIEVAWRIVEP